MKQRNYEEFCRKQADRARQLRIDELSVQKKDNPSTVNQLLSQIQELQDKVNSLNEEEFYDLRTASSCGMSHVPRNNWPRFCIAAQYTELDGYLRKRF